MDYGLANGVQILRNRQILYQSFLIAVHGMPQEICFKTSQLCTCFCKTMVPLCNMEDPVA